MTSTSVKIWKANVVVGCPGNEITVPDIAVKRIPIDLLLGNEDFIARIAQAAYGKNEFPKEHVYKSTNKPMVHIFYTKELGEVSEPETEITYE